MLWHVRYTDPSKGIWSAACTTGETASGSFKALGAGKGSTGTGKDNEGKVGSLYDRSEMRFSSILFSCVNGSYRSGYSHVYTGTCCAESLLDDNNPSNF